MWKRVLGKARIIVMDEAQHIRDIGRIAKVLVDRLPDVQLILCGSSSFELANHTAEPPTGRKFEYLLLPPSFSELSYTTTLLEEQRALESRLIYGSYPRIALDAPNAARLIRQIEKDYLYKDLLMLHRKCANPKCWDGWYVRWHCKSVPRYPLQNWDRPAP